MSEAEMNQLKKKLLDTTFLNSLYATTTPQEFDNFMFYLRRQKPYEIVVDGLNVMYRRSQLPDWRDALKNNMTMVK